MGVGESGGVGATAMPSNFIRHELHHRSKIELWEIRRAQSGQLVQLLRKLGIVFSVERRCLHVATWPLLATQRSLNVVIVCALHEWINSQLNLCRVAKAVV